MNRPVTALLALGITIGLPACTNTTAPPEAPTMQMRSWSLPPGTADRVQGSLEDVLFRGDGGFTGRAVEGPGGSLVVVAPTAVLDGVDELVETMAAAPPPPAKRNVLMEYWVVVGSPSEAPTRDPRLAEVSAALDAIEQADGAQRFELHTDRMLRSVESQHADVNDEAFRATQFVQVTPGTDDVVATVDVNLPWGRSSVETTLSLSSGEVAVLAQSGLRIEDEETATVYLLVRPTID